MKLFIPKPKTTQSRASQVEELEGIFRKLYEHEKEVTDFSAAIEWWKSLSPEALNMELLEARERLKKYKGSSHSSVQTFTQNLKEKNVSDDVITAILQAVKYGLTSKDQSANAYARSMERSYDEYGIEGVKMQVTYLLLYLKSWTGEEAKAAKKLLRKWAK